MTYSRHVQSAAHTTAVANFIAQQEADEEMLLAIQSANHPATPKFQEDIVIQSQASISPIDSPIIPPSPLTFLRTFDLLEKIQSNSEESDGEIDIKSLSCALEALAHDQDGDKDDLDEEPPEEDTLGTREESNVWYPFKKKEYQRIRSILRICAVNLPGWGSLRDLSIHMKTNLEFNVIERLSPSGTPLFGLDIKSIIKNELANPLVSPHLVFIPERSTGFLSPRNGVSCIVKTNNKVMAKCLPAEVQPDIGEPEHYNIIIPEEPSFNSCKHKGLHPISIPIINPWREKAEGKVIRYVPITLYSDDTSANVSKKWNKHMSIFFTLAGLSPEFSNQEFNIHFLATSNIASALELLDEVVDNLNLGEEVLVVPVVLCHLGDLPMHAEICNTTNPAYTLTPCRICELKVARLVDKKDDPFVRDFLGINNLGERIRLLDCNWDVTRSRTKEIWTLVKDTNTKSFNGHQDTPVETLHVVLLGITKYLFCDTMNELSLKRGSKKFNDISAQWKSFDIKGLNTPPILPNTLITFYQSLVGKEFRTVLQTVPFVLFEHISIEKRKIWTSLCLLASYIFQTKIHNIEFYLKELDAHIQVFLNQLISHSAQWVNKPKIHMLIHLGASIERFGPACLFATEKFESYNGVLCQASIHSNHQSPGNNIANGFNTYQMMRLLMYGGSFIDQSLQERVAGGKLLTDLFQRIPELYLAMGLKRPTKKESPFIPGIIQYEEKLMQHLKSVTMPNGQKVEARDFVLIKSNNMIARVQSIWKPIGCSESNTVLVLKQCCSGQMVPFYGMREILLLDEIMSKKVKLHTTQLSYTAACPKLNLQMSAVTNGTMLLSRV
ncbi:hypothetical protein DFH28DRAFT_921384 [Melampsora americana]|nr:hypothetical protein DFH28DRAFT_921384 [Melampsora americana]